MQFIIAIILHQFVLFIVTKNIYMVSCFYFLAFLDALVIVLKHVNVIISEIHVNVAYFSISFSVISALYFYNWQVF